MKFEDLDQTLQDKLLRLQTKTGNVSDYVALICQNGTVQPAFFDLRNDAQVEYLKSEYIKEWQPEIHAEKQREQSKLWEKQKFDAAEKIKAADWGEGIFWSDDYYSSVDDFLDFWESNMGEFDKDKVWIPEPLPKFVYAAKKIWIRKTSVGEIVEDMFADLEFFEDTNSNLAGKEELQAALDKFYELNRDHGWYEIDYKKIILL